MSAVEPSDFSSGFVLGIWFWSKQQVYQGSSQWFSARMGDQAQGSVLEMFRGLCSWDRMLGSCMQSMCTTFEPSQIPLGSKINVSHEDAWVKDTLTRYYFNKHHSRDTGTHSPHTTDTNTLYMAIWAHTLQHRHTTCATDIPTNISIISLHPVHTMNTHFTTPQIEVLRYSPLACFPQKLF